MMALPFRDATFDVVTTGYGIRNVPVISGALAEIARVLRPGGVFLSLDFDRPSNTFVRAVYLAYLTLVGSTLGFALHGDPDTYRYIPESIRRYPGAEGVSAMACASGFATCERFRVLGGLMALHRAVK
jgi:demethylmenaquinone methyltransferase/2-methoxy-6-polyprenyl-1,4-benzoquinol methylase